MKNGNTESAAPAPTRPGAARRRNDPTATRLALLTAARHDFALKGLAGARVDEIAARAGVNKQLVYHYFGDKEALYLAALESAYAEIRSEESKLNLDRVAPRKAIRLLVETSFDHLQRHPEFVALLNDENRYRAAHVTRSSTLPQMHSPFLALIRQTLARGVEEGVFRAGLDPLQVYISIAGLSFFFFSNGPTLSAVFGKDLATPAALRRRRKHVADFVLHALAPHSIN